MSALEEDGSSTAAHLALEEKYAGGKKQRGGGGGGRGGRGGGGGQGREVQVSKALSKLLRHQAENAGIKLDAEGFAALDEVLNWGPIRSLKVTLAEIKEVVASNEKQRFTMKLKTTLAAAPSEEASTPAHYVIRANQGHSVKIESAALLEPITLEVGNVPPRVLHGTYFYFWPAIEESGGLKVMGRNHIHCSTGTPEEGVMSGMRKDAELVIEIDVEKSLQDGIQWWRSDNGVLLTEGGQDGVLSTAYFKKVTGRNIDVGVLWGEGERLSSLPEGIKGKIPPGKGPGGGGGRGRGGRGKGR
ncbi:tRNA 2'-phosphotransferase 1 [Trichoderma asperellum]|uniref:2'-phosphotransferase n=1 Tax=Trichoderma asperellum TaxID=101201 RepID=A0A6V8QN69_TRIAP|nr:tRNA 2'-phosphotransferase 1 [Trichoderma asperellum]